MRGRAIIGLNCSFEPYKEFYIYKLDQEYIEAIRLAGGIPVILPLFSDEAECKASLELVQGLLLTGGKDINPARWGEDLHPKTELIPLKKEESDFLLVRVALKLRLPILAICYGHQLINVVLGGNLHQHLADLPGCNDLHTQRLDPESSVHPVELKGGSLLAEIFGKRTFVNSYHHQAVRKVGAGLRISAVADDGMPEGLESPGGLLFTVQWHPERMLNAPGQLRLFETLVQRAQEV
jgi:putative glutamine amidotransferase